MMIFCLAAGTYTTASAGKKKDKKAVPTAQKQTVALVTPTDSVSYAAGYAATQGLLPYLQNQLHVDTMYLAEVVRGYQEAISKAHDPAYIAYAAGQRLAEQVNNQVYPGMNREFEGTADSLRCAFFHEGFTAGVMEDTTIYDMKAAQKTFESRNEAVKEARNAAYKSENEAWLQSNATKAGVTVLPSGLQYKVLKSGSGDKPQATDMVEVIYEGKMIDGTVFDATSRHDGRKTDSFRCNQVIKGWTEALTNMPVGSKWEVYIPQELAYGSRAAGQIKPYSTLIFTIELVGIGEKQAK